MTGSTIAIVEQARAALDGYAPNALPLDAGRRESAVLVLLVPHRGDDCVVFQLRTHRVAHHRGQISLPGGARDDTDPSLLFTALRETHEEIGIPPETVEVLGQLDDTTTTSSPYRITPFVGVLDPGADVVPAELSRDEVTLLIHVPVAHLMSEESRVWKVVERGGVPTATPAFGFEEHVIWGATARIVGQFVSLLGGPPLGENVAGAAGGAGGARPGR